MSNLTRKQRKELGITIIGKHIEKYRILMVVVLTFLILIEVALSIYWNFDENNISPEIDNTYLASHILLASFSLIMIGLLVLNKYKKIKTTQIAVMLYIYGFLLMLWGTGMCIVDLKIGISPFIFLIVAFAVSSLFVIDPFFFLILISMSFISIITCHIVKQYSFFSGSYAVENVINFIIFCLIASMAAFRHYRVTVREYVALKKVEELTYYDELTGLLNERSYLSSIEELNASVESGKISSYAVVIMDLNNLKATNDAYGHRFGCHLVVRAGHSLPDIFKSSKLFHIGGDEFLAIVLDEDYQNFDKLIEDFDKAFRYLLIKFEDKELIFSIARGYSIYQKGDKYKDVLQRADDMMYKNKAEIKKTYHMKSR